MENLHIKDKQEVYSTNIIKVIGVGGAGNNAVNHMYKHKVKGIDYVVCNTDMQDLADSPVEKKLQIGKRLTEGLGAGSIPRSGKDAAEESKADIKQMLSGSTRMLVIAAGMGGGTGTGASPVIAQIAQEMGLVVVSIVTTPFGFERQRLKEAVEGIKALEKVCDAILIINNQKLEQIYGDLAFPEACDKANDILVMAAKSISEIVIETAEQNIDYSDLEQRLKASGMAVFGVGRAKGENRMKEALKEALYSPLLDNCDINGAKSLLVNIVLGSEKMTVAERQLIGDEMKSKAGAYDKMKIGLRIDKSLEEDEVVVTLIATNFTTEPQRFTVSEPTTTPYPLEQKSDEDFMKVENTKEIELEARRKKLLREQKNRAKLEQIQKAQEKQQLESQKINEVDEKQLKRKPKDPIGDLMKEHTKTHKKEGEKGLVQGVLDFFGGMDIEDDVAM